MNLDLEPFQESPKKKIKTKYKAALGVGSVASIFGLGSTLATNISLNGGGEVEFGQGVTKTVVCDEDGFRVTPVTSYDNEHSIFRVDYVQVSGLNLTPEGTGFGLSNSGVSNQEDAKVQYPGQYFDGTDWKRTCDNVVIDFKAYTDDVDYASHTDDAIDTASNTAITSPVAWRQIFEADSSTITEKGNAGFAVIFDSTDDGTGSGSNIAVYANAPDDPHGNPYYMDWWDDINLTTSNAEFRFGFSDVVNRPDAASISKITVQSMNDFPTSYYAKNDTGLGNPSSGW